MYSNGDKIRSMSNEELAKMMNSLAETGVCNAWGEDYEHEKCDSKCVTCISKWLEGEFKK